MVSIVLGKESRRDGQHAAARGARRIFGAGRDAGHAFSGLARARPSSRILAIPARAGTGQLFQRPGFSPAAAAAAGAESHGGDSALGNSVPASRAPLDSLRISPSAHPSSNHSP